MRSDSTDSIVGLISISSSWRMRDPIGSLLGDPELGAAPVGDDDAARAARQRDPHLLVDRDRRIDPRARDVEAHPFQLGGEARRQRIVVGQRQQHDARMRRGAHRPDGRAAADLRLRARRRRAQADRGDEQQAENETARCGGARRTDQ